MVRAFQGDESSGLSTVAIGGVLETEFVVD